MRLAFGTFLGLSEPASFMGDANYVRGRWRADPDAAFAAVAGNGELVGSNFATSWGSVGFFGPLTVRPDYWDRGVGRRLMPPILDCFARWRTRHAGLFTFASSPKHVGLYQSFGFWPRHLTAILSKTVASANEPGAIKFSQVAPGDRDATLAACRDVTDAIYEGLDLRREIEATAAQGLGETVLLGNGSGLAGFCVCHFGPGSEAGGGTCYVKFGAARPGPEADRSLRRLLAACESMALERGLGRLAAGVSTARAEAYGAVLDAGFRTDLLGVAMHRPNEPGYHRPGVYVLDDWR